MSVRFCIRRNWYFSDWVDDIMTQMELIFLPLLITLTIVYVLLMVFAIRWAVKADNYATNGLLAIHIVFGILALFAQLGLYHVFGKVDITVLWMLFIISLLFLFINFGAVCYFCDTER